MQKRYGLVRTSAQQGIQGVMVDIEVAISPGLPGFDIVGLADSAIRESRNRVQSAIRSSGLTFPNSRITASMAPAWLRKQGSAFDFPLALAILIASGQVADSGEPLLAFGELTLDGRVRGVPGAISRYAAMRESGGQRCLLPSVNRREVEAISDGQVLYVSSLQEAVARLNGQPFPPDPEQLALTPARTRQMTGAAARLPSAASPAAAAAAGPGTAAAPRDMSADAPDIASIVGQDQAVRALEIAAGGQHNLLLLGSPGSGKTALVNTIVGLLPPLSAAESLELTRIYSAAGLLGEDTGLVQIRPFRAPHHSVTRAAMLGGGSIPRPGEISLAHHGVLFLDEMTEFDPSLLDTLRQPMEEKVVRVCRSQATVVWPASFLLIGAANPCRCGNYLDDRKRCSCDDVQVRQHLSRLSGPLLDRIDLFATVTRLDADSLQRTVMRAANLNRTSAGLRTRICACRDRQRERCLELGIEPAPNGLIASQALADSFRITAAVLQKASAAAETLQLTVRGFQKILRVARTIADLEGDRMLGLPHLGEALQFRMMIGGI